jgi:hypothetical protein
MKRNDWILIITVLLYSLLFYHQSAGVNFLLFSIALVIFLLMRDGALLKNKNWLIAAAGSILSGICVAIHGNTLTVVANIISLSMLSGLSYNTNSSVVLSLLFSAYSYISAPVFMVLDYIERKSKSITAAGNSRKLILIIAPILVTLLFFFMYRSSNALFDALASKINFDFISWEWIMFTLLGFILMYGFYYYKKIDELAVLDENVSYSLSPVHSETSHFMGFEFTMSDENFSGILLFGLLNALVLIVNVLDINFLFGGQKLPAGVTYAEFIHQGVAMLIISIIVAISIILFYFRGGLNFYENNKAIKALACLWVLQNAFMLFSNAVRNNMCVAEYGLSYKHVGVYVYLLLTLVGLSTTLIKLLKAKNNMYLFRKNGWIFYSLLVILSFPDWDRMITIYNVNHVKTPNMEYLLCLSNSGLADLLPSYESNVKGEWRRPDSLEYAKEFRQQYTTRICDIVLTHGESDWRSWYYDDSRLYNDITAKDFTDKLTVIDINRRYIPEDSLSLLGVFDHVQELHLHSGGVYSLKHLDKMKGLTYLDMSFSGLFDISNIGTFTNLQYLNLAQTKVQYFAPLYELKNLKELYVGGDISNDEYEGLKRNLPNTIIMKA